LGCQTQKWARVTMNKNHEGSKAQSKQYMTGWTGLLHLVSESTSLAIRLCQQSCRTL
jgi:hypothetical protein